MNGAMAGGRWLEFAGAWGMLMLLAGTLRAGTRPPAVAGQFYPSDRRELTRLVDGYLKAADPAQMPAPVLALLVPHAGYPYSGPTAAFGYKLLSGRKLDTVILLGNSHRYPLRKGAVYLEGEFLTPLGNFAVNTRLAQKLVAASPYLQADSEPHRLEHSLEVQLPFLERTAGRCRIVPILMGEASLEACRQIGETLAAALRELNLAEKTVIIASSDLSHYPPAAEARRLDQAFLAELAEMDPEKLAARVARLEKEPVPDLACVICSQQALYTAIYAARALGANQARVLNYTNSGERTGERGRSVGYAAAAFYRAAGAAQTKTAAPKADPAPEPGFSLDADDRKTLLALARQSIENVLQNGRLLEYRTNDPELIRPAAVFVTLTSAGRLRGCIGTTAAEEPLARAVIRLAAAAAFQDPRFNPVRAAELPGLKIEISVLSPLRRAASFKEIKPGLHGVTVRRDGRTGLFLPQVWEQIPDRAEFLTELCRQKTGLNPEAWKEPETELLVFTVFSFQE